MLRISKLNSLGRVAGVVSAVAILNGNIALAVTRNGTQDYAPHVVVATAALRCWGDQFHTNNRLHVALYNPLRGDVSSIGWKLVDGEGTLLDFSNGFVIPSHHRYGFTFYLSDAVKYSGDHVALIEKIGNIKTTIDAVSWGTDTFAFNPALPAASKGTRMLRMPVNQDSDKASDWQIQQLPCNKGGDQDARDNLTVPGSFKMVDEGVVN